MTKVDQNWATRFSKRKSEIAYGLFKGECGGSYADAVLILSSALSGIASEAWPGEGIDRKRFVEALVTFCKSNPHPSIISLPALVNGLESKGAKDDAYLLKKKFIDFNDARILTGPDVDQKESEILLACPKIPLEFIRRASYANLIYTEVRSGFVHEYQPGEGADSQPMTSKDPGVSYANWIDPPTRRIVFHFPWLLDIVGSVAVSVDTVLDKLPLETPQRWWVEG